MCTHPCPPTHPRLLPSLPCMLPAGRVWEACDSLSKLPRSNGASLFRALAKTLRVVKDTLRELAEFEEALEVR